MLELNKQISTQADEASLKFDLTLQNIQATLGKLKQLEAALIKKQREEKENSVQINSSEPDAIDVSAIEQTIKDRQKDVLKHTVVVLPEESKASKKEQPKQETEEDLKEELKEKPKAVQQATKEVPKQNEQRNAAQDRPQDRPKDRQYGDRQDRPYNNRASGYNQNNNRTPGYNQNNNRTPGFNQNNNRTPGFNQSNNRGPGYNQGFAKDKNEQSSNNYQRPNRESAPVAAQDKQKSNFVAKKGNTQNKDIDKSKHVRKAIKERGAFDDEYMGSRKVKTKKEKTVVVIEPIKIDKAIITTELVTIKTLAEKTGKPASEIIKHLFLLGMMCTINSEIDFDTANLVCSEFGIELTQQIAKTAEETMIDDAEEKDTDKELITRPPVVTIMGHVDHGKTSLLDKIRATKVTETEAGGITQHIGAYQIEVKGQKITFLDTPGHEAFTSMRARGAQATDIAILVVAADDGVMPQTVEAINHAKAAKVPIIVAINKMDKAEANPNRVLQELTEHEILAEEWGGDTVVAKVSAVTGEGIDELLEMIILLAEVQELKANPNRKAKGTIIEAKLDKGKGPVATVLVQNGTLRISDTIVAGVAYGKVRAMLDDNGKPIKAAVPSQPVEVIGFSEVPIAGDILFAATQDKLSRQVAEERKDKQKAEMMKTLSKVSLDDIFSRIAEGNLPELNLIVKADVQGSVEALTQSLLKISNDEVKVNIIHKGVGAIKETDVMFATASNAIIIGFNVRPENSAREAAEREQIDIRLYRVIYSAIEDVENAMKGLLAPTFEENILGHAEVRELFKVSAVGTIAGSHVLDGKILRNAKVRLLRDNVVVFEGELSSLKRFKDDAKEVLSGFDCGITLNNFNDIKENDIVESYELKEVKR